MYIFHLVANSSAADRAQTSEVSGIVLKARYMKFRPQVSDLLFHSLPIRPYLFIRRDEFGFALFNTRQFQISVIVFLIGTLINL